ncbi:MAG: magnesium/cobalt transporter CorA [Anaerolineae bacterium]
MTNHMAKPTPKRSKKTGLSPGTLMYIGRPRTAEACLTIIHYDESHLEEKDAKKLEECLAYKDRSPVTWINVDGLDPDLVQELGHCFDVPPLVLEDILETDQRPKMEDYDSSVYIVLKMLSCNHHKEIMAEQVSLVLGSNFVLSFQERVGDVFEPLRQRLRNGKGHLRRSGPDYLAYALLDIIVDNYFIVLETLGEKIEDIEDELLSNPTPKTIQEIHHLKRQMIFLRKSVWPLREVITGLGREEVELITPEIYAHLRDVYDHTIQVIETIETYREMLAAMLELYVSSVSNRMNEVMKVLTIIATIFIPLTFISGIYGMNFYIPEVHWPWGYPVILIIMVLIAMAMLVYFRKKRWL